MDNKELLTLASGLAQDAAGWEDDEVSSGHKAAMDYYFQRPRGDEKPGRSQAVSGDLSAMVEANLAQMMDAFSTDNIVQFEPFGKDDEDQCKLESDTVSHFVMEENPGYLTFIEGIKDALLLRNGLAKVWVEDKPRSALRTYENTDELARAEILSRPGMTELSYKDGELKVREDKPSKRLRVSSTPIENFLYTRNWTSLDLQDIPFAAERHVDIRSDLQERFGREKTKDIPAFRKNSTAESSRNPRRSEESQKQNSDPSLDEIEWYEAYILADKNGDGIAERRKVCFVHQHEILSDYEASCVPWGAGACIINPHRFLGISLYDKLKQVQDVNTGLSRSLLDNANVSNKRRTAYLDGKVNVDDLDNGLVDGNIRVNGVQDVRQAMMSFEQPDISSGILANIQHQEKVRAQMGGAALDLATANAQLSDRAGSQGIDRAYSVMEQLAALMTRIVAESLIRNTFVLVHQTLRENFSEPVEIKRSGRWQTAKPSEWPERHRLNVKVGMSPGERSRKANAYQFIINSQLKLVEYKMDGVLVDIEGFYAALMDWARVSEIDNPEQYYIDPASDKSKQAADEKNQLAKANEEGQKKLTDMALGLEQLKIGVDKYKADKDATVDVFKALLTAETKEGEIVGQALTRLLTEANKVNEDNGTTDDETKED